MADGVVACDADAVLSLFNRTAREWHGTDPMRVPSSEWPKYYDLFRADGVTPLAAEDVPLARAFRGEPVVNEGMAIVARGRPPRFVLANGGQITDDAGNKLGAVVVMHDVTELRAADAQLRRTNETLEARVAERTAQLRQQNATLLGIIESAIGPIFSVDRECRYTSFNRQHAATMAVLYGARIELGGCLLDYMTVEADRDAARANLQRALAGESFAEEAFSGEDVRSRRYFRVAHSPILGEGGEVLGAAVFGHDMTERRRAEEQLRDSEQRYRDVFDNVLDGLYLLDVLEDGRFRTVEVNPALERLTGIPRSFSVGKTQEETTSPENAHLVNEKYRRCVESRHPTVEEIALDLPVGHRWFQSILVPATDHTGRVTRIVGISRDVTELKLAEEERQENLQFFEAMDRINRATQDTADLERVARDVLDLVLELLDCERAYLVFPCDPDAATWTTPMERYRPGHPGLQSLGVAMPTDPEVAETFRLLLAAAGPVAFRPGAAHLLPAEVSAGFGIKSFLAMALRPRTGQPWQFGIHQCSCPRTWSPSEVRLFEAIGQRLAEALSSLLAHRELRTSEAKYRRIVDTAREGIWALGVDDRTEFINARMAQMLDRSAEDLLGRPMSHFVLESERADHQRRLQNRRTGLSETYERRFLRRDGAVVWTLASATPLFDGQGNYQGSFAMFSDITERKRHEPSTPRACICCNTPRATRSMRSWRRP